MIRNNQDRVSGQHAHHGGDGDHGAQGRDHRSARPLRRFRHDRRGGNVEITSDNAGVRLQNIGGDARIDLRNSDIVRAVGVKGAFDLKGRGADIDLQNIDGQVTMSGAYSGVMQFRNLAKPLRFNGAADRSQHRKAARARCAWRWAISRRRIWSDRCTSRPRSRDVQISDFTNSLEVSVDRGDIELRPGKLPLARIDVQTRSGDIELSLPCGGEVRSDGNRPPAAMPPTISARPSEPKATAAARHSAARRAAVANSDGPHRSRPGGRAKGVGGRQTAEAARRVDNGSETPCRRSR